MSPGGTAKKLFDCDWFVFALILSWKLALLIFTAQPIPAGDAFFYDGAIVNYLNGGTYSNPTIALVLPISGNGVFSAYPPLYQAVLWAWMSMFGTSALTAMWLHVILFVVYALAVLFIFRQLRIPAIWVNFGCLFFLVNTFHDRPDTLAFALGTWSIYAWYRAQHQTQTRGGSFWDWLATALVVLTLCTSLQIGLLFLFWSGLLLISTRWGSSRTLPWFPIATALLVPAALVLMVKTGYPSLWKGFLEHVAQTPTLGGLQAAGASDLLKSYVLKALRTAPGLLAILIFIIAFAISSRQNAKILLGSELGRQLLVVLATGTLLLGVAFFSLTPNPVLWTAYPQPLAVGLFGAWLMTVPLFERRTRVCMASLLALATLGAARAVGITTWGMACAADISHATSSRLIRTALADSPPASTLVISSAFLYEAASQKSHRSIHADWLVSYRQESDLVSNMVKQLVVLKPSKLLLTQFDYYRRYRAVLEGLKSQPALADARIINCAKIRSPDSYSSVQKVVQHVSWAPVIVEFSWK